MRPAFRLQRFSRLLTVGLMGGLALLMGHSAPGVAPSGQAVASSQSMAQAWALAQTAQSQVEEHQTAAALGNFQRAYDLSGDPTLLLEVARLEHEVGSSARSAHAFQLFLERGADRVTEQRRLFAARQLRVAAARTARVNLQTNVQGAVVELEAQRGVATGEGFIVSVLLDAGERKLNLSKPGYETQSLTLTLEPSETRSVRVDLDKAAGGRSEAQPDKPRLALR
ncbi:MAG TPA: PEGA domain-containing protein [Polyangiaceae bacterium]